MTLFEEFEWRGMVYDATDGTRETLSKEKVTAYIGFDPTASSLHVGSLLPIMALARLQTFGHSPIALVGGGTGMIGDPSGKSQERSLLSIDEIDANARGMRAQLERFLDFHATPNAARMLNNADWLRTVGLLEFLRDTGKHFTVNYMLAKESVKRRLGADEGISFTEFSYLLLQAHDYLHLHRTTGCTLQMGGSDQWGNIVAGCDLIRKVEGGKAHGLVLPLVTTAAGTKFGKTEAGTVWLDPNKTDERAFYQFWLQTDDRDVIKYLSFFTWLEKPDIERLSRSLLEAPSSRLAQKRLAEEVTKIVHGEAAVARVLRDAAVRFGDDLSVDVLAAAEPAGEILNSEIEVGFSFADLVFRSGLAKSKSEARRFIEQRGVTVNGALITDWRGRVTRALAIDGSYLKVTRGRRFVAVVRIR